ncbi:MAG: hypothetical protein CR997_07840 [Acidobacteria bacterium]|nr:MAG: hypothetical protein CR997_07840 [Acidobacteriota bacterium]
MFKMLANDRYWIWVLVVLAAIKGFLLTASFPFFNNVDEFQHFDVIVKYSKNILITPDNESYDNVSIAYRSLFYSPEYATNSIKEAEAPVWKKPKESQEKRINRDIALWKGARNYESQQPPIYYALAGSVFKIGQCIGLNHKNTLYLLRWLNILFFIALIAVSYSVSKTVFFNQPLFFHYSIPLFLIVFPQESLLMLGNDSLHPLLSTITLLFVLKNMNKLGDSKKTVFYLSLLCVLTFFVKYSSVGIFSLLPFILLYKYRDDPAYLIQSLIVYGLAVFIPVALWSSRNYSLFGDMVGNMAGSDQWTLKPFHLWWNHPIFSFNGMWFFVKRTFASFWRGEVIWHGRWIQNNILDLFFIVSSLFFPVLGLISYIKENRKDVACVFALIIGSSLFFLVGCSLAFDFGDWFYPSKRKPFLVSGRLIMGMIVPFLILYMEGIYFFFRKRLTPTVIFYSLLLFSITVAEFVMHYPVFQSPFNWFHF